MTHLSDFPPDVQRAAIAARKQHFALSEPVSITVAKAIMADRAGRVAAKSLTSRQADCLRFIAAHQRDNAGLTPTYDEIKDGLGLASKSGVNRLIDGLVERGAIQRLPNRARAITIIANPASQQEQA